MSRLFHPPQHAVLRLISIILLGSLGDVMSPPVRAETRMSSDAGGLHLTLRDATVEQVLTRIGTKFDVHYRSTVILDRRLTGTYDGSLRQVIGRLLEGYDFVVKTSGGRIELFVLGGVRPAPDVVASARAAPGVPANKEVASGDSRSTPVQVAVGAATAKGPNRRTRPPRIDQR